ncbi:hypothetical protein F183_A01270 [Bryobacterales bacterium F-183]|nr:hypothetical protein F183_A01270 [Bryobacterales bacterium F-183]
MTKWKSAKTVLGLAVLAWGCSMAEAALFEPKPLDGAKATEASEATKKLDAEVTAFLRDKYSIASARYYTVAGEIPWIAVSKNVQNQMAEKGIKKVMFEWYEPGLDFVEVYPQGKQGFALAMPKGRKSDSEKLIGFYTLTAKK